ncbi:MAG: hypothetical protein ABIP94_08255 [Planctomycetota bacterium]
MSVVAALQPVVEAFERLGIAYHVGGSVASSAHGSPRSTNDVDVVAELRHEHVDALCAALGKAYYAPAELMHDAIDHRSCANVLHLATGFKVDIFVRGDGDYDRAAMARAVDRQLEPGTRMFHLATAEDTLLRKLLWFRKGGEVSERQWSDVLGVLRLRQADLDHGYLHDWSQRLGIDDLLAKAERETDD